jgi:hypothetical protein
MSSLVRTSSSSSPSFQSDRYSSRMCGTMPEFGCSNVDNKVSYVVEKSVVKTSHMMGRMQSRQTRPTKPAGPLSAFRLI